MLSLFLIRPLSFVYVENVLFVVRLLDPNLPRAIGPNSQNNNYLSPDSDYLSAAKPQNTAEGAVGFVFFVFFFGRSPVQYIDVRI